MRREISDWVLWLLAILGAVGACATVFSFAQGVRLANAVSAVQQETYGAQMRAVERARGKVRDNALRAYAVVLHAAASASLTRTVRVEFRDVQLRQCEGESRAEMRRVRYSSPHWMLLDRARASDALIDAVRNREVTYVVVRGHALRVRAASEQDLERARAVEPLLSSRGAHALIAAGHQEVDDDSGCTPPWAYAFVSTSSRASGETWLELFPNLAAEEENRGRQTRVQLWAY